MSYPAAPCSLFVYVLLVTGAIVLAGVSIGTPHWLDIDTNQGVKINFGLFKLCTPDKCYIYKDAPSGTISIDSDVYLIQGLMIAGAVCYALTLVVIAHLVLGQKLIVQSKNHGYGCLMLSIAGAILVWAGTGHFVSDMNDDDDWSQVKDQWSYGYSLYLGSTSGLVAIGAGISALLAVGALFNTQNLPHQGVIMVGNAQPGIQVVTSNVNTNNGFSHPDPNLHHPGMSASQGYPGYNVTEKRPPAYN